jgi:hypothetical protein
MADTLSQAGAGGDPEVTLRGDPALCPPSGCPVDLCARTVNGDRRYRPQTFDLHLETVQVAQGAAFRKRHAPGAESIRIRLDFRRSAFDPSYVDCSPYGYTHSSIRLQWFGAFPGQTYHSAGVSLRLAPTEYRQVAKPLLFWYACGHGLPRHAKKTFTKTVYVTRPLESPDAPGSLQLFARLLILARRFARNAIIGRRNYRS